jgi:leader peptidase (prepilin peptidase)/N-methyltransferase
LLFLFVALFTFGAAFGSFLNVVIARLPLGMSLYKPPSRCATCLTPIARRDNLPLLSYWRLKGRCRACGAPFSMRYFWAEMLTGLGFLAIYLHDVVLDVPNYYHPFGGYWYLSWGEMPPGSWVLWGFHAILLSLLIVCATCVRDNGKAPRSVLALGAAVGVAGATCFPWPWPCRPQEATQMLPRSTGLTIVNSGRVVVLAGDQSWSVTPYVPRSGIYLLPVWGPPPEELPAGDWRMGLATGLAGLLAGALLARTVLLPCQRHPGRVRLGDGEGDYLAVAGAFLGWQLVVVASLLAVVPTALLARSARRSAGPPRYPLGMVLMVSLLAVWFGWRWLGPVVQPLLFNRALVLRAAAVLVVLAPVSYLLGSSPRFSPVRATKPAVDPLPEHPSLGVQSNGDTPVPPANRTTA